MVSFRLTGTAPKKMAGSGDSGTGLEGRVKHGDRGLTGALIATVGTDRGFVIG